MSGQSANHASHDDGEWGSDRLDLSQSVHLRRKTRLNLGKTVNGQASSGFPKDKVQITPGTRVNRGMLLLPQIL